MRLSARMKQCRFFDGSLTSFHRNGVQTAFELFDKRVKERIVNLFPLLALGSWILVVREVGLQSKSKGVESGWKDKKGRRNRCESQQWASLRIDRERERISMRGFSHRYSPFWDFQILQACNDRPGDSKGAIIQIESRFGFIRDLELLRVSFEDEF